MEEKLAWLQCESSKRGGKRRKQFYLTPTKSTQVKKKLRKKKEGEGPPPVHAPTLAALRKGETLETGLQRAGESRD